ncbi:MAG: ATP-binding protein [Calditrichia bacterium]
MNRAILKKWNNALRSERYFDRHFLTQKPLLAEQLLTGLSAGFPSAEQQVEEIVNFVRTSALAKKEVFRSLFLLRDVLSDLLIERPLLPRAPLILYRKNTEDLILKLTVRFSEINKQVEKETGLSIARFNNGEIALRLSDDFVIQTVHAGLPKLFGYQPSELDGKSLSHLFAPASHSLLRFAEKQFAEAMRMTVSLDLEAISIKGRFFPVAVSIRRIANQKAAGFQVLIQQQDNRAATQNVLNLVTMALESVREGIVITEPVVNGRILFINSAMTQLSGFKQAELNSQAFSTLFGDISPDQLQDIFQASLEDGWEGEFMLHSSAEKEIPVQLRTHPIRTDDNEIVAVVSVLSNLERRKKHEARINEQNMHLTFLQELSAILGKNLDLTVTLDGFTAHLQNVFDHKGVDILLPLEEQGHFFRLFYTSGFQEAAMLRKEIFTLTELPFFEDITSGEEAMFSLTAENYPRASYYRWMKLNNVRHLVYLPVIFSGRLIGVVVLRFQDCLPFSKEDCDLLNQVVGQLTIAMKNFIHFDQIQKTNKKLQLISSLFSQARSNQSITSILSTTAAEISETFGYDKLGFYRERKPGEWRLISAFLSKGTPYPTNLIAAEKVTFPGIWLDCLSSKPFGQFFDDQLSGEQTRFALWLTEESAFRGKIAVLGMSESYVSDLSYAFHVDIIQSLLRELTLAIDHITLFQQTVVAEQEWQTTFDEVQIGLAVVDQRFLIQRANKAFWKMFQQEGSPPTTPQHSREIMISEELRNVPETHADVYWKTPVEWFDKKRNKYFYRRFFPLSSVGKSFQGGIFTVEDVSEARSKEKHIRYLSRFPEINPNLVMSLLKNGQIRYFNHATRAALRSLDLPEDEPRHLIPVTLMFELESDKFTRHRAHDYVQEVQGKVFQFAAFMPEGDDQIYLYGMEITERLEMQDRLIQTERVRATGEMATGVAHDFNNLLTTIIGRTQLTQLNLSQNNTVDLNEQLGIIEKAALEGAQIVKRLQELTRRKRQKAFEDIYLSDILNDSLLFSTQKVKVNNQVRGKKTRVTSDFQSDLVVNGNPIELKEVFTNLIFNAFDAMPEGGELFLRTISRPDNMIEIVVRDTGIGMSNAIRQKIFDPFFTTKGERGTGIGLSLVFNIITAHKGRIRVESKPGKGTTFKVWLPASNAVPQEKSKSAPTQLNNISDLTLLVVDDEPELLETINDILRLKFKQVDMANSGEEALKMASKTNYDIVLTDLGMPGMSGWEVAREMKLRLPNCRVVLVTGWGLQAKDELGNHLYVDSIIAKPYDVQSLLQTLVTISGLEAAKDTKSEANEITSGS